MKDPQTITIIASVLTGVLTGGGMGATISSIVTGRRDRRKAICEFRRKLGTLRSGFERQPAAYLFELYNKTVPKVQGDVAALKSDLRRKQYSMVCRAADAFTGIPRNEIEKPIAGGLATEFETGRRRILKTIDALEKTL
jgi:hypothetical protein